MKNLLTTVILFITFTSFLFAQYPRHGILPKYANGLIYNDSTIKKLRKIADSLNYQFKQIQEEPSFLSYTYTQAQYVKIDAKKFENRKEIFTDNLTFEGLIQKYPVLEINKNAWVYKETDIKDHHKAEFKGFVSRNWHGFPTDKWALIDTGNWLVHREGWVYRPFRDYEALEMEASFIPSPFIQKKIPQKYAKMIQYSDFLSSVPTKFINLKLSSIKKNTGDWGGISVFTDINEVENRKPKLFNFLNFVGEFPHRPTRDSCYKIKFGDEVYNDGWSISKKKEECLTQYYQKLETWDSLRIEYIRKTLSKTDKFRALLDEAIEETISTQISNPTIEFYIAEFKSKELALQLSLNRKDEGGFDNFSTQYCDHAKQILQLAAETANWSIFIDKHLYVLNDNFEPGCSHIKKGESKRTYIKELEEMGINVIDLLLGSSLRVGNPTKNHPYLDSRTVSRALSELKNKDEIEHKLLSMIQDQDLDDFNRMIICTLFKNYNCLLKDSKRQEENQKKYFKALSALLGTLGENLNKFETSELFYWFN